MRQDNDNFERRLNQRYDARLPLNIAGIGVEILTATKNISCSGVYCQVNQFIPVMTKLQLDLTVPLIENEKKTEKYFSCHALVVRTEPESESPDVKNYNIGLFFMDLSEKDRKLLELYIQQSFLRTNN